jgi:hypothetical protein
MIHLSVLQSIDIKKISDLRNHERYHEPLDNLTPADAFYGREKGILEQRELIKQSTLALRKQMHYANQTIPLT